MTDYSPLHCIFISTLIIFLGLQFGLIYKDLQELNYYPSTCTFHNINVPKTYSCTFSCNQCTESLKPPCNDLISHNEKLNPDLCTSNSTESCPQLGECSGGYKCCYTICQTCTHCSSIPNGNGGSSLRCTTQPCNCYCSQKVYNNLCSTSCSTNYKLTMIIKYDDFTIPFSKSYKTDSNSLNADLLKFTNNTLPCFHNTENTDVVFDTEINKTNFTIYGIFATLLLIEILIYFYIYCKIPSCKCNERHNKSKETPEPERIYEISQPYQTPQNPYQESYHVPYHVPEPEPEPELKIAEIIDPYNV